MPETPRMAGSPLQHQIVLMAQELATELEAKAQQSSPGNILDECEALLLNRGRQFLRDSLAATLQRQIDEAEKKGALRVAAPADTPAATKGKAPVNSSPPSVPFV